MVKTPALLKGRKQSIPWSGGGPMSQKIAGFGRTVDKAPVEGIKGIELRCGYLGLEDQVMIEFLVQSHGNM